MSLGCSLGLVCLCDLPPAISASSCLVVSVAAEIARHHLETPRQPWLLLGFYGSSSAQNGLHTYLGMTEEQQLEIATNSVQEQQWGKDCWLDQELRETCLFTCPCRPRPAFCLLTRYLLANFFFFLILIPAVMLYPATLICSPCSRPSAPFLTLPCTFWFYPVNPGFPFVYIVVGVLVRFL